MTFEEIMEMWVKDSHIDEIDLGNESIKSGKLHSKYASILSKHRMLATVNNMAYKQKRDFKRRYWRGDFNNKEDLQKYGVEPYLQKHLAAEIDAMLDADKELNEVLLKKEYNEEIVRFCESVIREINNRTYAVGNAIKFHIFMNGG